MNDKERITEILKGYTKKHNISASSVILEEYAEELVKQGAILPLCYIGQEIWCLCKHYDGSAEIKKGKISMLQQKADKSWKFRITINSSVWDFKVEDIGVWYFLTNEAAEEKMKELGK